MMTGWNAMMAAAVFLPVFVAGVMGRRRGRSVRLAAIGLAPLVPATPITFQVIGATMLSGFLGATVVATLAYGIATGTWLVRKGMTPT